MTQPNTLRKAINETPGKTSGVASICGVSVRAVYKWIQSGRLPRTDYTGETSYASKIAEASEGNISADWLLQEPLKEAAQAKHERPKAAA